MSLFPPSRDPPLDEILDEHPNHLTQRERIVRALHEAGGKATTPQLVAQLHRRNGPSTRQVAAHLRTRNDVEQETLANGGTLWILEPEVRP